MRVSRRLLPGLVALASLTFAGSASADKLTLGSDLSAPATVTLAQGADTAYWPITANGAAVVVPEDGQVTQIRVKGAAIKEQGAADPANMVHFQSLEPADANGARTVYLTSDFFNMPIDNASAVTTFTPENLCVHKGGSVAFNTIGGFQWGGGLDAPLDPAHYHRGTPWQIFASTRNSVTAWFSKDNGTKNGNTLVPAGGSNAKDGYGAVMQGNELLMQVVVATGNDRSQSCGGPRQDANGNVIPPISVNPNQDMSVSRDGTFNVLGYCGSRIGDCLGGTATVSIAGRPVATGSFSAKEQETIKVPLKLSLADYVALANAPGAVQDAVVTLSNPFGSFTGAVKLHSISGGLLTLKPQRPYIAKNRTLSPYGVCILPTGCTGTAVLTAKGKTLARTTFATTKSGAVKFKFRLASKTIKQLKKRAMAATLTVTSNVGTRSTKVTLKK